MINRFMVTIFKFEIYNLTKCRMRLNNTHEEFRTLLNKNETQLKNIKRVKKHNYNYTKQQKSKNCEHRPEKKNKKN